MKKSIYLSGPDILLPEGQSLKIKNSHLSWRSAVFHQCLKHGLQIINPIMSVKEKLNSNGISFIADDRSRKEVETSLGLIDRCDFLLSNLYSIDESSCIPLVYAHNKGKHTVSWTPFPVSPWLVSYSKACFESLESAIEYIVTQADDDQRSILDWSVQYETSLKEKSERFPTEGETDFHYFAGDNNKEVLLIAPHATSYWHLGNLFEAESYTGALVSALSKLINVHGIISSYCSAEDSIYTANYNLSHKTASNPLINFIKKLISLYNLKVIIIFRGGNWQSERDIQVKQFNGGENCDNEYFKNIVNHLQQHANSRNIKCNITVNNQEEQNCLQKLALNLNINILEITIHKSFLIPQMQRMKYYNIISLMENVLND